ncbi:MAG: hypothetical protein ACKVQU_24030 [Burkholderiales bacterium]
MFGTGTMQPIDYCVLLAEGRIEPPANFDFATLDARSKFWGDDQRAAFKNWEEVADPRNPLDQR